MWVVVRQHPRPVGHIRTPVFIKGYVVDISGSRRQVQATLPGTTGHDSHPPVEIRQPRLPQASQRARRSSDSRSWDSQAGGTRETWRSREAGPQPARLALQRNLAGTPTAGPGWARAIHPSLQRGQFVRPQQVSGRRSKRVKCHAKPCSTRARLRSSSSTYTRATSRP